MSYSKIDKCPITGDTDKINYFNLGNIPLVNNLLSTQEDAIIAPRYPLSVNYFTQSKESALECAIDSNLLFSNYLFKSEVNIPYYQHCKSMYQDVVSYFSNSNLLKITDIGGNDGTLLSAFLETAKIPLEVLNIDPSENLVKDNLNKNIPVLTEFFTYELSKSINKKVDIITSTNVFQHLKDLNSFVQGVNELLNDEGIWVLEFPYWIHDMETKQFDQIYHEHMYYHSITPLKKLMEKHHMKIVNITKQVIHGGTLRLIITKENSIRKPDHTIDLYLKNEEKYDLDYYLSWGNKIENYLIFCSETINNLLANGNKIYGFGAAAKGCIFLNSLQLSYKEIPYIIDDTDIKQNKFVPGIGSKIVDREFIKNNPPDYIIILAHNFADFIVDSLKDIYQGKYITFLPEFRIIE